MDSPYNRNNYKKKTTKRKTEFNNSSTQDPPKNENSKTTNKKTKNTILRGGDPNNEQPFQIDKADSILENKHENSKKYITIARRIVEYQI